MNEYFIYINFIIIRKLMDCFVHFGIDSGFVLYLTLGESLISQLLSFQGCGYKSCLRWWVFTMLPDTCY